MQAAPPPPPFPHTPYSAAAPSQSGPPMASEPPIFSGTRGDYQFSLIIEQQPIRARMCGFGDKDRRPITPPPCIRVVITDLNTGREVPADEIGSTFFMLSVDLWDEAAQSEKNIVRSSSNSPAVSISTATTTSFPVPPERPLYTAPAPGVGGMYQPGYNPAPGYPPQQVYSNPQGHPQMYNSAPAAYYQPGYPQHYPQQPQPGSPAYPHQAYPPQPQSQYSSANTNSSGSFTRNLIGSLAVNAFQLKDLDGVKGHWFILQDLSVRTEGVFRLKMSFIDIGTHAQPTGKEENKLNCGKTSVLASVFSQPFQVFSAKKFPGVIESTPLSKCFAGQGIKIPIRKDVKGPLDAKDEDDD